MIQRQNTVTDQEYPIVGCRPWRLHHLALVGVVLLTTAGTAQAQAASSASAEWRDPTELPAALRASAASGVAGAAAGEAAAPLEIRQLVFTQGRAYVVSHGRRLGVGDKLGDARIMRIDERAVWLSEGGKTRREPLFASVEKRPEAAEPATPAASAARRSSNTKHKSQPQAQAPASREKP